MSMNTKPCVAVIRELAAYFERNGYVRLQSAKRLRAEGRGYHKGDEIRLVAESLAELRLIRRLLRDAGFKPGRPFGKGNQWRQPVYGREEVARFVRMIDGYC